LIEDGISGAIRQYFKKGDKKMRTTWIVLLGVCVAFVVSSCKVEKPGNEGGSTKVIEDNAQQAALQAPTAKAAAVVAGMTTRADEIVILDCDLGDKPNNLGGDLGAWDKDPADDTQSCQMRFELGDDALSNPNGYSLRLTYDVESPNPAYNGFWTKLEGEDFSAYSVLNLYVRGDAAQGYTKKIKLEIKDTQNATARYLLSGITNTWQKFSIPFSKIPGMTRIDLTSMNEFVVVFDDMNSNPKTGSILIDNVSVSKS